MGQAVRARLWYPQLDAYDALRRMGMLLASWRGPFLSRERLFILDFYLATPEFLHETSLPAADREAFRALQVPRPESSFVSLPSPPLLFQKMAEVQTVAFKTMLAKGLLNPAAAEAGNIEPSPRGRTLFTERLAELASDEEVRIVDFLAKHLSFVGTGEIAELRRRTGLKRVSL